MVEKTTDFFENNDQALRMPKLVLRDSLGQLAIQILATRTNIGEMSSNDLLYQLLEIITNLHTAYSREYTNLPDIADT